jgi:competence ComEA-like helix-hairpin-helix protein
MRFPFFKATREEPKATPRTVIPVRQSSTTNLADTQPIERVAAKPASPEAAGNPGSSVTLGVASLIPQLPHQIFTDGGRSQLSSITLAVPVDLVLSQLSTGKISVKLEDLLPLFPGHLLRSPLPPVSDQQCVVLPLHEVIAAVPPEMLTIQHDSVITADDPELDKLPKLIDDALMNPAPSIAPATPAERAPAPKDHKRENSSIVVPPRPKTTDAPEYVMVSLRALVAVMPDAVFCCPRAQLSTKVNLDTPVLLPTDPILPQLRSATVKLPLSIIMAMVPHQVLANPMPALDGQMIPIPLAEIIPQLPKSVFTDYLREPSQEDGAAGEEMPDPFHEKGAIQTAEIAESPEPIAGELGVDEAALEDESFSIFSERSAAPAAEVTPPAPVVPEEPQVIEPIAEPVAEVPPVVEPPVEPVVEPIVEPVAAVETVVEPEPVIEQVVPAEPEPVVAPVAEIAPTPVPVAPEVVPAADEKKLLVDLNRCSVDDLTTIPGIGRALAQRIVDFRNSRGQFHSVDELRQVPGIGRKTFRALAGIQPRALNRLLGAPHDGELTLQEIVRLTGKLPGIEGCMLATSDGLFLTGELPPHLDQATISVFAPQLFKKVGRYARELKVGSIRRFTIFTDTQPISIFRAGDVYLIVIHDAFRFSKALLRRCERISHEIARLSSQRVTV